jgi:hypothetical protein
MEIVALLLAWAFALTFVAFVGRPKQKTVIPVPVRVSVQQPKARMARYSALRQNNRQH